MSKRMLHIYCPDYCTNKFAIGYMVNPKIHVNKVFIETIDKCLNAKFHEKTMENIRDDLKKKNKCVIALIMFYENKGTNPEKVYRVLS